MICFHIPPMQQMRILFRLPRAASRCDTRARKLAKHPSTKLSQVSGTEPKADPSQKWRHPSTTDDNPLGTCRGQIPAQEVRRTSVFFAFQRIYNQGSSRSGLCQLWASMTAFGCRIALSKDLQIKGILE